MLTVLPLFSQLTTVFPVDPAEMMYKMVRDCDTVTLIALFARYAVWVSFPWNSIASFNVNGFPFLVNIYDSVSKIKDEQTNVRQSVFLAKTPNCRWSGDVNTNKIKLLGKVDATGTRGTFSTRPVTWRGKAEETSSYSNSFFFRGKKSV